MTLRLYLAVYICGTHVRKCSFHIVKVFILIWICVNKTRMAHEKANSVWQVSASFKEVYIKFEKHLWAKHRSTTPFYWGGEHKVALLWTLFYQHRLHPVLGSEVKIYLQLLKLVFTPWNLHVHSQSIGSLLKTYMQTTSYIR